EHGPNSISFIHRSFLEYFSARVISKDQTKIPLLVAKRHLHETIVMSCGLLVDIAPIIETAISQRELLLAAKCVSQARTKNPRLSQYVYKVLLDELGAEFLSEFEKFRTTPTEVCNEPDIYEELLYLWDGCFEDGLNSYTKGQRFESFAVKLFNSFSKVVRQDLHTENGELDLICENVISTPFWQDYGGEFPVECKNWSSNIPINEVGHFAHKMEMTKGVRLAFFVSVNGFTEDARRMLRNQAARETGPLVVPISGAEIKEAILKRDNIEDFFKEAIRDIKFLRKF
ncbi:MAG: restriction endonuclease, partial [Gallionella sp.]